MPLDATGAYVPELVPVGVPMAAPGGAPPLLPLNPMETERSGVLDPSNPNSRPLVTAPGGATPPMAPPPPLSLVPAPGGQPPAPMAAPAKPRPARKAAPAAAPAPEAATAGPGDLNVDQLAAASTVPNDEWGDAVDRELAGSAQADSRAAAQAAAIPQPPATLDEAQRRVWDAGVKAHQAAEARLTAQDDATAAAETAAHEEGILRAKQATEAEAQLETQRVARAASAAELKVKREKAAGLPYHSFWESKSTGQKVLAGIGVLLSGISFDSQHKNQALDLIHGAIQDDFKQQEMQHAALWKDVSETMAAGEALRSDQLREMSDFKAAQGMKLDAFVTKAKASILATRGRVDSAALQGAIAEAEKERNRSYLESLTLADKAAEAKKLQEAQIRNLDARTAKAKRVSTGGGSAGSPALAELLKMQEDGKPGSEIAARAAALKIPAGGSKGYLAALKFGQAEKRQEFKESEKSAGLEATDGEGKPIGSGEWKNPQAAAKGNQQVQRFHRVKERLVALIEDVKTHGERIGLDSKEYVRRQSLAEAVAAALRPYNELSSTDASMKAERAILGPTGAFGHGWTMGADLKTLKHILSEAEGQQTVNLNTLLRSSKPEAGGGGASTRTLKLPNGEVATYDVATGKRVK